MATDGGGASSISVTVRVRPFTIREAAQLAKSDDSHFFLGDGSLAGVPTPKLIQKGIRPIIKVVDERCLVFDPPEDNPVQKFSRSVVPQTGKRTKDQTFGFDRVFDENTTQSDVYEATTKGLLDNVLDGYNATVFAYGATGCGKTHTVTGTAQQPGIIFLTMQDLFEKIFEVQQDKVTEISLSYLEIYNETIRDLLVPGGSKAGLMLREDSNQTVSVTGLSSHHPQNVKVNEVMDMIVRGNEYRTMSPTEANATSSRSHAVLQINLSQKDRNADVNEPHTMATLSIIDLAGSERASATKNRGERLMEGANINKSLLALGSCINALCDPRKKNHVPYRNSKLTRLLKFSLGGNCKTVMIVCVSPSSSHFDETQNTLRYANRAKNIQTKVTRNIFNVNRHVKDFLKKIDEQMAMINELKEQQKDYENVAFVKFKKQNEKRDSVVREGLSRLRNAYDHSQGDRIERINKMKKLRQIERRISMITSWIRAFDSTCDGRGEEDPPRHLESLKKAAQGILVELESSRHHYHQTLSKDGGERTIDTALQTGLKQLREADAGSDESDSSTLIREAELLKSNAEREQYIAVLENEKAVDSNLTEGLLYAHFETVATLSHLMTLEGDEAVDAAKDILDQVISKCSDATSQIIKPEGSIPITEALPPIRSGTPKRKKNSLLAPSPKKISLPPLEPDATRLSISPMKSSPRRRKLNGAKKGVTFTPKKRSPVKRAVRWRDDFEEGTLAEYEKTPQRHDGTPDVSSSESALTPIPETLSTTEQQSSSPLPDAPRFASEMFKPRSDRFQTGFLSRRTNGSPAPPSSANMLSSSPLGQSPLQEITANQPSSKPSSEYALKYSSDSQHDENYAMLASSDSEKEGKDDQDGVSEIAHAMRRASLSRAQTIREQSRTHRRRSPPSSASPPSENLFTTSHARRMVKSDRDSEWKLNILSPHATPVFKASSMAGARRTTLSDDRFTRPSSRGSASKPANTPSGINPHRGSMVGASKAVWR